MYYGIMDDLDPGGRSIEKKKKQMALFTIQVIGDRLMLH